MDNQISELTAQELLQLIYLYGSYCYSMGIYGMKEGNTEEYKLSINEVEKRSERLKEIINSLIPANK